MNACTPSPKGPSIASELRGSAIPAMSEQVKIAILDHVVMIQYRCSDLAAACKADASAGYSWPPDTSLATVEYCI